MIDTVIAFLFQQYGIVGVFAFIILVIIMKDYKSFVMRMKQILKLLVGNNSINTFDVLQSKLNYWIEFKIQNMYLKDPGRKEIFKDIMNIRFRVFKDTLVALDKKDVSKKQPGELYSLVVECLHKSTDKWETECVSSGVPDVVIDKYKKWSSKNLEFALKAIEMVCYSEVYGDNNKRMQAIYSLYTAMLEITMAEAERSLNDLNGELNGLEYKGYVCCDG